MAYPSRMALISAVIAVVFPLRVSPVTVTWRDWLSRVMLWGAISMRTSATEERGT